MTSRVWFTDPEAAWRSRLAPPNYQVSFEHDVKIPMRDGVHLSVNLWRPAAAGRFPVILLYTPYDNVNKNWIIDRARYFAPRGYAVAAVDARGRYDSDGVFYFYWSTQWRDGRFNGEDVYDCQTWLGEQPWSSGKIGMTGGSYLGFVQWMSAMLANPYLSALIPWISPDDHYDNVYPGGAMQLSNSCNLLAILATGTRDNKEALREHFWNWDHLYRHLPLRTMDQAMFGHEDQMWRDLIEHPDNDYYWRFSIGERPAVGEMTAGHYRQVAIPTLNITGWYDQVSQATINNYLGMMKFGPRPTAHTHHLIVGPWRHASSLPRKVGDVDYGAPAEVDHLPIEQRWFDYWLAGIPNGMADEQPVSIFVMGENQWRSETHWPPAAVRTADYYLRSGGKANSSSGDGYLSTAKPEQEPADSYIFDPANPVPSIGGNVNMYPPENGGPKDQRPVQQRADVLVYTGSPLPAREEICGRILVKLFAATTAPDTDFTAKLCDVHPNGYAQILTEGIIRGRYRISFRRQELLNRGEIYEFTIDLWSICHVVLPGHRIQVEISSSNFPKYDRNPNTGGRFGDDEKFNLATQTVLHDEDHPSRIILPFTSKSIT
jgi:putative CocE/NonD family hydrolase